ncbi:VQ motif-containing protein 33 [Raphanus sativus]|uniref:VQ motif-containing protein 33-like n=1 Tax=Raphanus sativus TaxID=3726 RepID=A0A9W3CE16_RAPSA|nr:VQ motif-containing protein 33-like [Raphanus sativus]KAJ4875659.1 VQ motif-containing protein 33 [Raphanus sativus]
MEVSSTSSPCSKPEQIMPNFPPLISSPKFQHQMTRSPHHDQHQHLSNPYPTTFVQADTSTFKQVVQMLTGSSSTDTNTEKHHEAPSPSPVNNSKGGFSIPPIKKTNSFKLYERRQNNNNNMFAKNDLMINTLRLQNSQRLMFSSGNNVHQSPRFSPRDNSSENVLLSPSMLDFPKLGLNSPVTPLRSNNDPFNKSSPLSLGSSSEEDKAIAEKGYYLHPSPVSTPRDFQPLLLPLFPVTSPRNL